MSLTKLDVDVEQLQDASNNPHWGSRQTFTGIAQRRAIHDLLKLAKLQAELPKGPGAPSLMMTLCACSDAVLLQDALEQWYQLSKCELPGAAGEYLKQKCAALNGLHFLAKVMQLQGGTTSVSRM